MPWARNPQAARTRGSAPATRPTSPKPSLPFPLHSARQDDGSPKRPRCLSTREASALDSAQCTCRCHLRLHGTRCCLPAGRCEDPHAVAGGTHACHASCDAGRSRTTGEVHWDVGLLPVHAPGGRSPGILVRRWPLPARAPVNQRQHSHAAPPSAGRVTFQPKRSRCCTAWCSSPVTRQQSPGCARARPAIASVCVWLAVWELFHVGDPLGTTLLVSLANARPGVLTPPPPPHLPCRHVSVCRRRLRRLLCYGRNLSPRPHPYPDGGAGSCEGMSGPA